jgi:Na+/melibiose symporter-like transporter
MDERADLTSLVIDGLSPAAFFAWEQRVDHPMLEPRLWTNPRFSAASGALVLTSFAFFGAVFLLTQYVQFLLGLSALQAGARLLAFAVPMVLVAPFAPRVGARIGTKLTVAVGLTVGALSRVGRVTRSR